MERSIEPPDVVEVDDVRVSCDGGGALGHPKVYLSLGEAGRVDCPYCDRMFILKPGAGDGHGPR